MATRLIAVSFAVLIVALAPVSARRVIDLENATIADFNAAFKAGTLTSEKLMELCLARIEAYDRRGPALHAMIVVNPKALETARALDAERKAKGPRSALHGIPSCSRTTSTRQTCRRQAVRCCSKGRFRRTMRSW